MKINKKKLKRFLKIFTLSIVGLISISATLFFIFLDDIIESRLKNLIEKKFGSYYTLEYDHIEKDIGLSTVTFVIKDPTFKTDTTNKEGIRKYPILFFEAKELSVANINTWDIIWGSDVELGALTLEEPHLDIHSRKKIERESSEVENRVGRSLLSAVKIGLFSINKGKVNVYDYQTQSLLLSNNDIQVKVQAPIVSLEHFDDIKKAFQYDNISVKSSNTLFTPMGNIYNFSMDSLDLETTDNLLKVEHIVVGTNKSMKEESYDQPNQIEVVNMDIDAIQFEGFDAEELIYNNTVRIEKIDIKESQIEVFKNLMTDMDHDFQKYVMNENLRKIPIDFDIDSIHLQNSNLEFRLMNSKYVKPAELGIRDIQASIANFNNDFESVDTLQVQLEGKLMDAGLLTFEAAIPIQDSVNNYQSFKGELHPMKFSLFNPIIQNFVNIKVREGLIDALHFQGECNSNRSKGSVEFAFSDVKIDVYSLTDHSVRKKNKFLSFISGLAFYSNHPTATRPLNSKSFYFSKQNHQGSVMMWVGGIIDGMMKTILKKFVQDQI